MTTNNLITLAEALWQSGIVPALLILAIGWLSARFARNKRLTNLLGIAEAVVKWAEVTFDGGQLQKAQAIKMISDYLMKADKAHLFTAKQIDEAIETVVKDLKGKSSASEAPVSSAKEAPASSASDQVTTTSSESTTEE